MEIQLDRTVLVYVSERDGSPIIVVSGADGSIRSHVPHEDRGRIYITHRDGSLIEWRIRSVDHTMGYVFYMVIDPHDHSQGASVKVKGDLLTFMGVDYKLTPRPKWSSLVVMLFDEV